MDFLTFFGIILGVTAIVGGQILEGGHISSILQLTAALIVFGGTIAATIINYPMNTVITALRLAKKTFIREGDNYREIIEEIAHMGRLIRKDGLLALESEIEAIEDPFFKKGAQLVVDGAGVNDIRNILEIEMNQEEERKILAAKVFESAGGYAPTIGILGAVLGLIQVMENLAEPARLGEGIAVAFVATVYGVGSANLFWLPLAGKMKVRTREESIRQELIMEGLLSLAKGENPRLIQEKLEGFLMEGEKGVEEKR